MAWIAAASVLSACSLDRTAIVGPGRMDAETDRDGGLATIDADSIDAFVPGADGGPEPDAFVGPPDGGDCASACDGEEVVRSCTDGSETRYDCRLAGATCDDTAAGVAVCAGGACDGPACSSDGRTVLTCPGGVPGMPMACARGCSGGACRGELPCPFAVPSTIVPGETRRIALCGTADNHDHDGSCSTIAANGEDVTVRLDVDHAGTYRIESVDSDGSRRVDPIVYLRSICDSQSSQVACDDDGGSSARDARLDVMLEAGEYFLVIDSIEWTDRDPSPDVTYECGEVTVSVTER